MEGDHPFRGYSQNCELASARRSIMVLSARHARARWLDAARAGAAPKGHRSCSPLW